LRVLADSPWKDHIVLFNGSNNDDKSKQIYHEWLQRHEGTDCATGSRLADMRSAIVDYFKHEGQIMIATEAETRASISNSARSW
jgi:adenine-specific DNA-methyltransferase